MGEIIARFADGLLLVQEDKALERGTLNTSGQALFRIGNLKTVTKVLSINASISGYPNLRVATELRDIAVSGDTLIIQLRRADLGEPVFLASSLLSGFTLASGPLALSMLSGITSGIRMGEPIVSTALVSGVLRILANVIGY